MRAGYGVWRLVMIGLWALPAAPAEAVSAPPPASYVRRLEQQALLQAFQVDLLGHDSATAVLQSWCDAHGGGGVKILAERLRGEDKPLPAQGRAALAIAPGDAVAYRHVRLTCGGRVLSEADNWYRPDRLTAAMNAALDNSDAPFGVVVRPLGFRRRNLISQVLYQPLPPGWERLGPGSGRPAADADASIPSEVIRNSAVLTESGGDPFSYVVEIYTGDVIKMALPAFGRR